MFKFLNQLSKKGLVHPSEKSEIDSFPKRQIIWKHRTRGPSSIIFKPSRSTNFM